MLNLKASIDSRIKVYCSFLRPWACSRGVVGMPKRFWAGHQDTFPYLWTEAKTISPAIENGTKAILWRSVKTPSDYLLDLYRCETQLPLRILLQLKSLQARIAGIDEYLRYGDSVWDIAVRFKQLQTKHFCDGISGFYLKGNQGTYKAYLEVKENA